jgi:hypothetical protein
MGTPSLQLFFPNCVAAAFVGLWRASGVFSFVGQKLFFGENLPARGGCATVSE